MLFRSPKLPKKTSGSSQSQAQKRPRPESASTPHGDAKRPNHGPTPQSSRASKGGRTFADTVKGSKELIVRRKDEMHISKAEWDQLLGLLQEDLNKRLDDARWTPDIVNHGYNVKQAAIFAEDQLTVDYLRKFIKEAGFLAMNPADVKFTPTTIMSGFIKAPQGHQSADRIAQLVERIKMEMRLPGKVAISSKTKTPSGCILRLSFDVEAAEVFKAKDCFMHFGLAGRVQFTDVKDASKTLDRRRENIRQRLEELQKEMEIRKAEIKEVEADRKSVV